MKDIVQKGDPVLRQKASEVKTEDISSSEIKSVIADMQESLAREVHGVAIAAPQIGVSLRIFVVSGKIFNQENTDLHTPDLIYINPTITHYSEEKKVMGEGCLSVRGFHGKIERSEWVTLESYDETGTYTETKADGLLAQIFQHETDHLNGILYIDTATDIQEENPSEG